MMPRLCLPLLLLLALASSSDAFMSFSRTTSKPASALALSAEQGSELSDNGDKTIRSRREMLKSAMFATLAMSPVAANALDMDAFASSQIEADVKNCNPKLDPKCIPKLNADEALCKYGQSGNARGEACKRVKAAGGKIDRAPQGKSLGGAYAM